MLHSLKSGTRVFGRGEASVLRFNNRAVDFLFDDTVVTLVNKTGILTPSSVVVNTDSFPLIRSARVTGEIFQTDKFAVVLGNFRDLGIHERAPIDRKWVARTLAPFIFPKEKSMSTALLMSAGRDYHLTGMEKMVAERQRQALELSEDVPGLAQGLLGLGFGATPSGDEFVLGMIALGKLVGEDVERLRPIIENYDNPSSRTSLRNALDGFYSEPVYDLLKSVIDGSLSGVQITRLLKASNSSGEDIIAGMFYSLGLNGELCSFPHISDYEVFR